MTKKYSVKDLAYLAIMGFLGLLTVILGSIFIFTSDIQGLQNDSQRAADFLNVKYGITNYISSKGKFPATLKEVESFYPYDYYYSRSNTQLSSYKDPKTKDYYELKYDGNYKSYQLCTEFQVGSKRINFTVFDFEKGKNCVTFELDSYSQQILKGERKPNGGVGKPEPAIDLPGTEVDN